MEEEEEDLLRGNLTTILAGVDSEGAYSLPVYLQGQLRRKAVTMVDETQEEGGDC